MESRGREAKISHIMAIYDDGYAESAIVKNERMLAFKPVCNSFFQKLSSGAEVGLSGIIPLNIVGLRTLPGSYIIIFRTKAMTKNLTFSLWEDEQSPKKKPTAHSIPIRFPDLLWVYSSNNNGDLQIYKETERDLYYMNMSNVTNSKVCIGDCPRPSSKRFSKVIEEVQEMFFDGIFTHNQDKPKFTKLDTWIKKKDDKEKSEELTEKE